MPKSDAKQQIDETPPNARGGKRLKWPLLAIGLVALAPSLLTWSGQHKSILGFVNPELKQAVAFESITTHWWSPVKLTGVTVRDLTQAADENADATALVTIDSVSIQQPLWKLALSMGRGMEVTLQRPVVNLRVTDGVTNVEQTIAELFGESESSSGDSFPIVLNVEDGKVRLLPSGLQAGGVELATASIDGINGRVSTKQAKVGLPEIALAASLRTGDSNGAIAASQRPTTSVNPRIAAALDDIVSDQPLMPFTEAEVADLNSRNAEAAIKIDIQPATESGQRCLVEAHGLELSKIEPLLQRLMPGTRWDGTVSCRLDGLMTDSSDGSGFGGRTWLQGRDIRWRSNQWAAGESIALKDVTIQGACAIAEDGILINGLNVASALLDASGDGEVRLAQPDAVRTLQDAAAERSSSDQSIVNQAAAAATGKVTVQARLNVAALAAMLPKTLHVDDGVDIASAEVRVLCRVLSDVVKSGKQIDLLQKPGGFRWELVTETSPIKATKDGRPIQVDSSVRLDALGHVGPNRMDVGRAMLSGTFGTVNVIPEDSGYAIDGVVKPLELWNQLKPVLDIPQPNITGDVTVKTRLQYVGDAIRLSGTTLQSNELQVTSRELKLRPAMPILEMLEGDLSVRGASAAVKTLVTPWHDAWWLSSDSNIVAELQAITGQRFALKAAVTPIVGSRSTDGYLEINDGRLTANLTADATTGAFLVESSTVQIPGLDARVTGAVSAPNGVLVTNLDADTQYDLSVLSQTILGDMSDSIQLLGSGRETILLRGSPMLWTTAEVVRQTGQSDVSSDSLIRPFELAGRIPFSGGRLYGLALGPGEVRAQLKEGLLRAEPIHCSLGSGELDVMPQWDLNRGVIQLASGSRVQNLAVTPELCGEWLGYVAPMMTDAASLEGTLSARIQRFHYFVDQPNQSTVQGVLTIQNASASPGSSLGPLLQVLQLAGQTNAAGQRLELPAQEVTVVLNNGMVTHQGLEIQMADYRMTSSGSVGLNKQIQLELDVPLERSTADERGRSIKIPVGGTIGRPVLNTQGLLQNFGRQQIDETINKQLDRGLNRLLDKLR